MPQSLRVIFGFAIAAVLFGGPAWYASYHHNTYRNFRVVEPGVLYRSGQMSPKGLTRIIHDYGIKTVISLRDGEKANDVSEEAVFKQPTVYARFVRLPHKDWSRSDDGLVPAEENLEKFRKIMDDPINHPVLVHCFAGVHRTGAYCAFFRMDYQGWSNDRAMQEMRALGYDILDKHENLKSYLDHYKPRRDPRSSPFRTVSHQP